MLGYSKVQHHSCTFYTCLVLEYIFLMSVISAYNRKMQSLISSLSLEANWHSLEVEYILTLAFLVFFYFQGIEQGSPPLRKDNWKYWSRRQGKYQRSVLYISKIWSLFSCIFCKLLLTLKGQEVILWRLRTQLKWNEVFNIKVTFL